MKWIKMKKNYPGNNSPIPGLERCMYMADREYQVSDDAAGKLIKTRYAESTTAPWERNVNPAMIEVDNRKREIEKLQGELVKIEQSLQNAREIALTIPVHENKFNAAKDLIAEKLKSLETFAGKNNIFLTKEDEQKAISELAKKAIADTKAARKKAGKKASKQNQKEQNENTKESQTAGSEKGSKPKDDGNSPGQAASTGQGEQ